MPDTVDKEGFINKLEKKTSLAIENYHWETLEDKDWVKEGRKGIDTININNKLLIIPSWKKNSADETIPSITMDPGLAFGSGNHATTYLCLEWLTNNAPVNLRVLDFGCGSGILSLAAKKLGAEYVAGVDTDPLAVKASLENAAINSLSIDAFRASEFKNNKFDLILANILLNPLLSLAETLFDNLSEKGDIVLSGILEEQLGELKNVYSKKFSVKNTIVKDNWALMVCTK